MKKRLITLIALGFVAMTGAIGISAQNSAPPPGAPMGMPGGAGPGGPGGPGIPPPNPGPAPTPPPPGPAWGSPWNSGWGSASWENNGYTTVMACGYDAQGVWRVIPLYVNYNYNGIQYNVTVVNAYDPWTDTWNYNVDAQAFNTSYYINGNTYNFYVPLSTGTYYFNL